MRVDSLQDAAPANLANLKQLEGNVVSWENINLGLSGARNYFRNVLFHILGLCIVWVLVLVPAVIAKCNIWIL